MTSLTCGIARYTGATHGSAATVSRSPRAARRASSGSLITASPIHCGATTRDRVMSMRGLDHFAGFQPVHRAAIRALALAGARHVEEHARMAAPQRHPGVGAEDHAPMQVLSGHFDRACRVVVHRHQTLVSHSAYLA